jgi:hypothetical protein
MYNLVLQNFNYFSVIRAGVMSLMQEQLPTQTPSKPSSKIEFYKLFKGYAQRKLQN